MKKAQSRRAGSPQPLCGPVLSLTPPKSRLASKYPRPRLSDAASRPKDKDKDKSTSRLASLQAFFSPNVSPRPQSLGQVWEGRGTWTGQSQGRLVQASGDLSARKKDKKKKPSKNKTRIGKSADKEKRGKYEARDFWAGLASLRQVRPHEIETSRKSAIITRSVMGLGLAGRTRGSNKEPGMSERVTGETSLARSLRKFGERSDWSFKKSTLLSPSGHNFKTFGTKERPNNSDLTTKIREVMKKNGLASTSRIRNKVNSEVSAISLVGLEEQFKYHQSKMLTKNKVSLLGMKVDKLIKAVQESNSKVQSKTLNDYLGFDKFTKKSTPTTPPKTSRRLLNHKREIMYSFPDYNLCQPANYKALVLKQQTALNFCKRMVIKKGFMPRQLILSRDSCHIPEVRCFIRHPDKPDSKPIFKLLLSMMPAKDSSRPQVQNDMNLRLQESSPENAHSEHSSTPRQSSYQCILPSVENIVHFTKSKVHLTKLSNSADAVDYPNTDVRIMFESPSYAGISCEYSIKKVAGLINSSSVSNKVQSEATRILSPFTSPMVYPQEAKNKLAAFKQLKLKGQPISQGSPQLKNMGVQNDQLKVLENESFNESNLKKLLSAKKALMKVTLDQPNANPIKFRSSGLMIDPKLRQNDGGTETPKFIDTPKTNSKPLNLLASLKQLKSTLPKNNFPN
jgi:hypothetical protein